MVPFAPSRWLPGPNLMTVVGRQARPRLPSPGRRERWELPDGDFLEVEVLEAPEGAPGLVVLHGLEGSSRSGYIVLTLALARERGLAAWALNFRSCSGEPNRLARSYHSGETGDLAYAVERILAERPGRPLALLGFSLGGNVVGKYLGERGEGVPSEVRAAAVVSTPFDLASCAAALDGPGLSARVYRGHFLRSLRAKALAKARRFPGLLDARQIARARTFREFDGCVTAPLHGFAGAEDYWARSSSGPLLCAIRRPLLAIQAEDDPFVPFESLFGLRTATEAQVRWEVTSQGGHLGFVEGPPWHFAHWAERQAVEFLAERLR